MIINRRNQFRIIGTRSQTGDFMMQGRRSVLTAAAALAAIPATLRAQQANWPKSMTLATASPGGAFAVYGQAWATLVSDLVKIPTSTQQTQGPNQNVVLVQSKRVELGMTTLGPAFEAWTGDLEIAKGTKHTDIRALFPMYETPFQIVTMKRSGIDSVAKLQGKIVGVGPRAGTPGTYYPRWFDDLGIKTTIRNGAAADMGAQLADGRLDAFAFAAGIPIPAFSEIETQVQGGVNFFSFTKAEIDKLLPKNPFVSPFTIPAGTYKAMTESQLTVAMWNFAIAHKDLPEDLAYTITKTTLDNASRLVTAIKAAEATVPANAINNGFLTFHLGAVRYFKEKGIALDPRAIG
jgi:TRAP transporter TAXI family solute receptor